MQMNQGMLQKDTNLKKLNPNRQFQPKFFFLRKHIDRKMAIGLSSEDKQMMLRQT